MEISCKALLLSSAAVSHCNFASGKTQISRFLALTRASREWLLTWSHLEFLLRRKCKDVAAHPIIFYPYFLSHQTVHTPLSSLLLHLCHILFILTKDDSPNQPPHSHHWGRGGWREDIRAAAHFRLWGPHVVQRCAALIPLCLTTGK